MLLKLHSLGHWCYNHHLTIIALIIQRMIFVLYSAVIPSETEIGEGTILAHGGLGNVFHPKSMIGKRVLIAHGVTIGGKSDKSGGVPVIGDDVYIGAGAKILGDITIGNNSLIGANAVVIKSVPAGSLVVGVPAKIIKEGISARDYETW